MDQDFLLKGELSQKAFELLIEAVAREARPGVLELRRAASMLRDLLEDPTPQSYALACQAFDAIDAETRRRIGSHARVAAETLIGRSPTDVLTAAAPAAGRAAPAHAHKLLSALNAGTARPAEAAQAQPKTRPRR